MARSIKRNLSYACALFLSTVVASGQNSHQEIPSYSGSIEFFVRGSGNFRNLTIFEKVGSPLTIDLFNGRRSTAYDYVGRLEYGLFRETGVVDGVPQYALAGKVTLSPETSESLILVIENPAFGSAPEELEFLMFGCDDSASTLPWDHVAFWNLTGAELDGVLGDDLFKIGDGLNEARSIEAFLEDKSTLIGLSIRYSGRDRILLQSRKRFYPNRRIVFVLLPPKDPESLAVEVFRITEINRALGGGAAE